MKVELYGVCQGLIYLSAVLIRSQQLLALEKYQKGNLSVVGFGGILRGVRGTKS